jgi:hypothetical protein
MLRQPPVDQKQLKLSGALRACAAMKTKCFLIRADRRRFFGRITRRGRSSAVAEFSGNKTNNARRHPIVA